MQSTASENESGGKAGTKDAEKRKDTLKDEQAYKMTVTFETSESVSEPLVHHNENGKTTRRNSVLEASVILVGLSKQRNKPLTVCFIYYFFNTT